MIIIITSILFIIIISVLNLRRSDLLWQLSSNQGINAWINFYVTRLFAEKINWRQLFDNPTPLYLICGSSLTLTGHFVRVLQFFKRCWRAGAMPSKAANGQSKDRGGSTCVLFTF